MGLVKDVIEQLVDAYGQREAALKAIREKEDLARELQGLRDTMIARDARVTDLETELRMARENNASLRKSLEASEASETALRAKVTQLEARQQEDKFTIDVFLEDRRDVLALLLEPEDSESDLDYLVSRALADKAGLQELTTTQAKTIDEKEIETKRLLGVVNDRDERIYALEALKEQSRVDLQREQEGHLETKRLLETLERKILSVRKLAQNIGQGMLEMAATMEEANFKLSEPQAKLEPQEYRPFDTREGGMIGATL